MQNTKQRQPSFSGKRVVIVGGGLVGSYAGPLAARMEGVQLVRVIDGDTYTISNLKSQAITPDDVGRPKADVMARRMRRQSPGIQVEPICSWLEHVPRGLLRSDVVLSCLDSRRARCLLNETCWRLGVPLLDAAVDGAGLLARTNLYQPGPRNACLECSWNVTDYQAVEQVYACQPGVDGPPATDSPAALGHIAAGLLINECQRLFDDTLDPEFGSRQILWDCRNHRCLSTRYRANPGCRFDHGIWEIEPLVLSPRQVTLAGLYDMLSRHSGELVSASVPGQHLVNRLVCGACGAFRDKCLYLPRKLASAQARCHKCGQVMKVSGFHATQWLVHASTSFRSHASRSLASIGFRASDILAAKYVDGYRHFELRAPDACHGREA